MFAQQPFRLPLSGRPQDYQTYQVTSPRDVLLPAACEQVGCQAWLYGWESHFDERTDLGLRQATYVRQGSGRTFTEHRTEAGITVFRFEPKQRCFADHKTRPEAYLVRAGDWRQNLGLIRRHSRPADFVEDFGEHQQRVADQVSKG